MWKWQVGAINGYIGSGLEWGWFLGRVMFSWARVLVLCTGMVGGKGWGACSGGMV